MANNAKNIKPVPPVKRSTAEALSPLLGPVKPFGGWLDSLHGVTSCHQPGLRVSVVKNTEKNDSGYLGDGALAGELGRCAGALHRPLDGQAVLVGVWLFVKKTH